MNDTQKATSHKLGGVVFLLSVITALIYGAVEVNRWLEDEQRAPIHRIMVSGQYAHVSPRDIEKMIRTSHPGSFFELNVESVHRDLEAMPWVYRASVRKRWPNNLSVYLVEQEPAAIWNHDLLLNKFGESFPATLENSGLPTLFGPGGSEQTALNGFRAMQSLLAPTGLKIEELLLSERFAWDVRLNNGVKLKLGRSQFVDKLQRFVDVYPLLAKESREVLYVDLRYDTGLAVGWKPENQTERES
ncbi:cell division protein FtsQ/DivIB [Aestuariibacter sp. AA17]|uniref:Cell division protein FtsQ n=1 Tax=Fluctibacter corallii TaxID=2984329 RepID=A0ABT3A878_9ALTE|nr:cell division protein FtsQ/DivIB [Aestuariibacter sp. AA17]MCV2884890.1 cell division protein FtsQ/DivIB [Aestuariibacter sp. AA17]